MLATTSMAHDVLDMMPLRPEPRSSTSVSTRCTALLLAPRSPRKAKRQEHNPLTASAIPIPCVWP
jgi:hypothetical protein